MDLPEIQVIRVQEFFRVQVFSGGFLPLHQLARVEPVMFIMGPNTSMAEADPERVKVWVDATREYGVY